MNYMDLDIQKGFVLNNEQALGYLRAYAMETYDRAISDDPADHIDIESATEIVKDIMVMAQLIYDKDWEWVKFDECQMAVSNICVKEMGEKGE